LLLSVCAEGNGTPLIPGAAAVSSYYRGFPPAPSPYITTDGGRASFGHADDGFSESEHRVHSPPKQSAAMESDSSGEDGDISVCSLDVTSSPTDALLTAPQIEAS